MKLPECFDIARAQAQLALTWSFCLRHCIHFPLHRVRGDPSSPAPTHVPLFYLLAGFDIQLPRALLASVTASCQLAVHVRNVGRPLIAPSSSQSCLPVHSWNSVHSTSDITLKFIHVSLFPLSLLCPPRVLHTHCNNAGPLVSRPPVSPSPYSQRELSKAQIKPCDSHA